MGEVALNRSLEMARLLNASAAEPMDLSIAICTVNRAASYGKH